MNDVSFSASDVFLLNPMPPYTSILKNISFFWQSPQVVCLLGHNGSGKTSFLKACAGLVPLDQGKIQLNGVSCMEKNAAWRALKISWLAQNLSRCENFKTQDFLLLGASKNRPLVFEKDVFDVQALLSQQITSLSGGEWKRVQLARIWQNKSKILLLDEPDSDLDPKQKKRLGFLCKQYVHENQAIVIVATHDILFARTFATTICLMHKGTLVWNSCAHSFWKTSLCEQFYGHIF